MVRLFDSRYKVNLTSDSNPRPSEGQSCTVNVYTRSDIEAHKLVPGC